MIDTIKEVFSFIFGLPTWAVITISVIVAILLIVAIVLYFVNAKWKEFINRQFSFLFNKNS